MRPLLREAWGYAILLVILCTIAAVAVWQTIEYAERVLPNEQFPVLVTVLWSITLGFMLIAGAFGLWAIQFSAEAESRRRVGRIIDAMDHLQDAMLVLDPRGRVTGSSPSVPAIAGHASARRDSLDGLFPCLTPQDVAQLTRSTAPVEIERRRTDDNGAERVLRFRAQPSEGLVLVTVSDISTVEDERTRARSLAQLQLIGQIARGVAHDFNNILFAISSHATLAARTSGLTESLRTPVRAISREAERGMSLAGHLLELARPLAMSRYTAQPETHIRAAARAIQDGLPGEWTVSLRLDQPLPPVGLSGIQLEQVITNAAFAVADASVEPANLCIHAVGPMQAPADGAQGVAVSILIGVAPSCEVPPPLSVVGADGETGAIPSIIENILGPSGGGLDLLRTPDGTRVFRLRLPHGHRPEASGPVLTVPDEIARYLATWKVLLALRPGEPTPIAECLDRIGAAVTRADDIVSTLAHVEGDETLDGLVISRSVLGQEYAGLLRAIVKLRPGAAVVVLCDDPLRYTGTATGKIVFVEQHATVQRLLAAIVESSNRPPARRA